MFKQRKMSILLALILMTGLVSLQAGYALTDSKVGRTNRRMAKPGKLMMIAFASALVTVIYSLSIGQAMTLTGDATEDYLFSVTDSLLGASTTSINDSLLGASTTSIYDDSNMMGIRRRFRHEPEAE